MQAVDGQMALNSAITNNPALLLLDVDMPEMDGFQVCRALKRHPACPRHQGHHAHCEGSPRGPGKGSSGRRGWFLLQTLQPHRSSQQGLRGVRTAWRRPHPRLIPIDLSVEHQLKQLQLAQDQLTIYARDLSTTYQSLRETQAKLEATYFFDPQRSSCRARRPRQLPRWPFQESVSLMRRSVGAAHGNGSRPA